MLATNGDRARGNVNLCIGYGNSQKAKTTAMCICLSMFIAALFIIVRKWRQLRWLSKGSQSRKWPTEFYSWNQDICRKMGASENHVNCNKPDSKRPTFSLLWNLHSKISPLPSVSLSLLCLCTCIIHENDSHITRKRIMRGDEDIIGRWELGKWNTSNTA